METSIGTYQERALHAELKRLLEPDETLHEVRYKGYIADILNANGAIEVQTRSFERLRAKLTCFLNDMPVTLVFPAVRQKWLVWIHPETGEATKKRRSPKVGTVSSVLPELYKIKPLLHHANLRVLVIPVDVLEYRSLTGWSADKKRGSTRLERIPAAFGTGVSLDVPGDYRQLIPAGLEDPFTASAFGTLAKLNSRHTWCALNVLTEMHVLTRCGKRGNAYLYERTE